ncbi:MAG: hydrogenase maturation nickel metallochaperone HypA [Coriobacteriaceae bacterium]|nr:hydrogenase maturation nickel metallochaperone HypA [Coriobacteriaceae bacterium]MDD7112250.1 hydrogenase maturation nickel metallochaperone HypA [Coriobacteriaceae bacterium]MDY5809102.1 hydrogenase maturation nickel metallochaperone HypA [Coriobacteriales bacterium]
MHEYSIVEGVLDSVIPAAEKAGADRIVCVRLRVGDMTEVVQESLDFMWGICCEQRGPMVEGCRLEVEYVYPRSACLKCGHEFEHDRFHLKCPECGSASTMLLSGRELEIASMDVDIPDDAPAEQAEKAQ